MSHIPNISWINEIHYQLRKLAYDLIKRNIIGFDTDKREYVRLDNGYDSERHSYLSTNQILSWIDPPTIINRESVILMEQVNATK